MSTHSLAGNLIISAMKDRTMKTQTVAQQTMERAKRTDATHKQVKSYCTLIGATFNAVTYYRDEFTFKDGSKLAWNHDANPGHEMEVI